MKHQLKNMVWSAICMITIGISCTTPAPTECSKICKYLKDNSMSEEQAIRILSKEPVNAKTDSNCNNTCCEAATYCGITFQELKNGMVNYRDNIWSKTSSGPTFSAGATAPFINYNELTDNLDARLMEVNLAELENYICYVKRLAAKEAVPFSISSLRFYYIQYPGSITNQTAVASPTAMPYSGCHSLAIVPVNGTSGTDYISDSVTNTIFTPCMQSNQTAANHNDLCPPFRGCIENTLINLVDARPPSTTRVP